MSQFTKSYGITQMQLTTLLLRQMPKDVKYQQQLLLLHLSNLFIDGKEIDISIKELSKSTTMSTRTVITHMNALEEKGYIKRKRVGLGENNQYSFDLDAMQIDTRNFKHNVVVPLRAVS